jgi:alpha-N-acetylglucosamine transferase
LALCLNWNNHLLNSYITLITNPDYLPGAIALARSLRMVDSAAPLTALVLRDLPELDQLEAAGCTLLRVDPLPFSDEFRARHSREAQHKAAPFTKGNKPDFHNPLHNFVKLRLWELEQFEKVVFLDADTIVVQNIDRLFSFPEFVAAPNLYESLEDFGRMNSGVFVAKPNRATFDHMLHTLDQPDTFWRRTDQTFLETYFPDWEGLPYTYNTLQYVWFNLPALWDWQRVRVIHYQYEKPWEAEHPKRAQLAPLIDLWQEVHTHGRLPDHLPNPPGST